MPKVVLKGPMRRYGMKGKIFDRGVVSKTIDSDLRDELIGTGFFKDAPKERKGKVTIKHGGKKANPTGGGEDWSDIKKTTQPEGAPTANPEIPMFKGRGAKVKAIQYAAETYAVQLSNDLNLSVLNEQIRMLAEGASVEEINGAKKIEAEAEPETDANEEDGDGDDGDGEDGEDGDVHV